MKPQNSWYTGDPSIADAHDDFERVIPFTLPYPRRPQAITHLGSQPFKPPWIHFVVASEVVGFRPK